MSKGEAYFRVHADRRRPFVVRAGPIEVTAVGTAFNVTADESEISVTVSEGVVTVAPARRMAGWAAGVPWRVPTGYRFEYSEKDGSATLSSAESLSRVSWSDSRLEYVNAPLAKVVADINQYTHSPVEIADATTGMLSFTGTVFTNAVDPWLDALPGALPVRINRAATGAVTIRARPKSSRN